MSDIFTRYRENNTREDTSLDYVQNYLGVTTEGSFGSDRVGLKETIEDNNNPGWRKRQNRGEIVMSGMRLQRNMRTFTPGNLSYSEGEYGIVWNGDMTGMCKMSLNAGSDLDQYITQMRELSLTSAFAKIDAVSVSAGEFLADFGSTMKMLRSPFSSAQKLLVSMERKAQRKLSKKGRKLIAANGESSNVSVSQAYSDVWLETQYGWKPIVTDIEKVYNSSVQLNGSFNRRSVVRASEETSYKRTDSFEGLSFASPLDVLLADGQNKVSSQIKCSAGVIFDLMNRNASVTGSQFFGVRAQDLPVTFWQVLPYSFVVDWFVNVESWIQACTPKPDVEIRGSWTTIVRKATQDISGTSRYEWPTNPPQTIIGSLGTSHAESTLIERETNRSAPSHPTLNIDYLTFNQTISGLALLVRPLIKGLTAFRSKMS